MPQFNRCRRLLREIAVEMERQRKVGVMREERGSSEKTEDFTAIRLIQRSVDSVSDEADESEDDEVPASEGEELQEADESALTSYERVPWSSQGPRPLFFLCRVSLRT